MPRTIRQIRIEGNVAYVPLTRGFFAIIDAVDVAAVNAWNWTAMPKAKAVYAFRAERVNFKPRSIMLHRFIMGEPDGFHIDHIDGDGLNNCRSNLRLATHAENMRNGRIRVTNTSGVKGVSWHRPLCKWQASIRFDGRTRHLGYFADLDSAAAAYAKASVELHGEFGRIG